MDAGVKEGEVYEHPGMTGNMTWLYLLVKIDGEWWAYSMRDPSHRFLSDDRDPFQLERMIPSFLEKLRLVSEDRKREFIQRVMRRKMLE